MTRTRYELGNIQGATESASSAMDMARMLLALNPADRGNRQGLATASSGLGTVKMAAGQLESAVTGYRAAIEIRQQLVSEQPNDVTYRRDLMVGYALAS